MVLVLMTVILSEDPTHLFLPLQSIYFKDFTTSVIINIGPNNKKSREQDITLCNLLHSQLFYS